MIVLPSGGSSVKSSVHTLTPRERPESKIFFLNLRKNTIFNENPVFKRVTSKMDAHDRLFVGLSVSRLVSTFVCHVFLKELRVKPHGHVF